MYACIKCSYHINKQRHYTAHVADHRPRGKEKTIGNHADRQLKSHRQYENVFTNLEVDIVEDEPFTGGWWPRALEEHRRT